MFVRTWSNANDADVRMKSTASPFYPPRAGRSRYLYRAMDGFRAWLHLSQLGQGLSVTQSPAGFFLNCLVPGFGFRTAGWDQLARVALGCWLAAFVVYFIWIGRGASTFAFGVMLSIHSTGIICAVSRAWPQRLLVMRVLVAVMVSLSLTYLAYAPALGVIQRSALMPIWWQGGLYVVNRTPWGQELQRGDLVAYKIQPRVGPVDTRVQEGTGLDRVVALPGDVIEFRRKDILINGVPQAKHYDMPNDGRRVLSEGTWLVWPTLDRRIHGEVPPENIRQALLDIGTLAREDILGKPFGLRLWRTQNQ